MSYLIELNSKYFFKNIEIIKKITNCQIAPVLKSNAYGHGSKEIISLLKQDTNINYICVINSAEAKKIILYGWEKKIIVMSPFDDIYINPQCQYFLYSFTFLDMLLEKSLTHRTSFEVHIKLNCGLNRFGFKEDELDTLIDLLIKNKKHITVVGICTHLPRLNYSINKEIIMQIDLFNKKVKKLQKTFGYELLIHPFSSKGINLIHKSNAMCTMVRVGGSLYGLLNSQQKKSLLHENNKYTLNQIMTLKTKIIMIQSIKKNEYIGYGSHFKTKENSFIAITNIGYGNGYNPLVLQAPVSGYYNDHPLFCVGYTMNSLFFDVTEIQEQVKCGEYIILSSNEHKEIKAAHLSNTYIKIREYAFTTMLHESIEKKII